jgi:hypothetical protein
MFTRYKYIHVKKPAFDNEPDRLEHARIQSGEETSIIGRTFGSIKLSDHLTGKTANCQRDHKVTFRAALANH